ncbi:MAG: methylated-DNA--[protein]-cysteine S-methyltransferase [Bacteroidetes bacterium]|nr:methylated-DNA--[protein]-cysteine S-methyltransferase [Bacteroidota bacterium]
MPADASIYYTSPVGLLRLSSTGACISEVHFCNDAAEMREDDPAAPPMLNKCRQELIEHFQKRRKVFEVPVNQEGTPFQLQVWGELLNIPYGKTISYLTLSKRLGDPKAIRAAASTNGKNRIAIIVPCHRVIGSNNDLVGYGGGLWRKKVLLELEAKYTYGVQTLF